MPSPSPNPTIAVPASELAAMLVFADRTAAPSPRWGFTMICRLVCRYAGELGWGECRFLLDLLRQHEPGRPDDNRYGSQRIRSWESATSRLTERMAALEPGQAKLRAKNEYTRECWESQYHLSAADGG